MNTNTTFDVAVIGLGPAGATLANLLGQMGLTVLVIEREAQVYPLPRAIHFDGEVMRVFESIGLKDEILKLTRTGSKGMHFHNASGQTMMIRAGKPGLGPHGFPNSLYFHQPELENILRNGLTRWSSVQVRTCQEVISLQSELEFVELTIKDLSTESSYKARAQFVVGCDGARSMTRSLIGSKVRNLGLQQSWLVFDVRLKTEVPTLPDYTVQHCDPSRPMTYCNVTGNRRRWEIMIMPGDDPKEIVKPNNLWKMVSKWIQPDQADIERAVIYTFHSLIAEHWRKERLLLAGDSAHQTPPFLGQGMCAAIRDASNLAWKLRAVIKQGVCQSILDTYEKERAPHVQAFIELAVKLGSIIQTTDPVEARARDAKFLSGAPQIFEFPAPRLGPGIWLGQNEPVAQIFPQPVLINEIRLDERVGHHFAVIGESSILSSASPETILHWTRLGVVQIDEPSPEIKDWLDKHQAKAVIIRPDRYIVGLARSSSELDEISTALPMPTEVETAH